MNTKLMVDPITGECIEVVRYITAQQQEKIDKKNKQTKNYRQFTDNFIWVLFDNTKEIFPEISSANLVKYIYLATFCRYDKSLMLKNKAQKLLGLSKKGWYDFWNMMTLNGLLREEHGMIYLLDEHIAKGKLKSSSNISHTRLFCDCIQSLYESNCCSNKSRQLACLFRLIPYVHPSTNIVCYNPNVECVGDVQCMNIGDFCEVAGYNRSSGRRFLNDLLQTNICGEPVMLFETDTINPNKKHFIVNPRIYYGGKNDELYAAQSGLFGVKKIESKSQFIYSCGKTIKDVFDYFSVTEQDRQRILSILTPMGYSELNMCYAAAIDRDRLSELAGTDKFANVFINSVKISVRLHSQ